MAKEKGQQKNQNVINPTAMSRKAMVSLVFGLFMAFTFTINSLIKGELETAEEIQTNLIAVVAAGIVSGGLLYFFVKDSQVDKIWGKEE